MVINPFDAPASKPGHGKISVSLLPPSIPVLDTLSYQYPLKLIAPAPVRTHAHDRDGQLVYTVFLLTYGGGLVAGDIITLSINLAPSTRLILLTQGSTKLFKSPSPQIISGQCMTVGVAEGAIFCYLPDPAQPFENSAFQQKQVYNLLGSNSNLCVLDWVNEGRPATGEIWSFRRYVSKNEVWAVPVAGNGTRRLLLRDNVMLDNERIGGEKVVGRMSGLGVFGTLILGGKLFSSLGDFFITEFKLLPRIGNRQWDLRNTNSGESREEARRVHRIAQEVADGVLWSVAAIRGFVVVKFGARKVEGVRQWLGYILRVEGTIERECGERALLCLR